MQWFAATSLLPAGKTVWEQVDGRDVQQWMAWLLGRYSSAYASNQYHALQQGGSPGHQSGPAAMS